MYKIAQFHKLRYQIQKKYKFRYRNAPEYSSYMNLTHELSLGMNWPTFSQIFVKLGSHIVIYKLNFKIKKEEKHLKKKKRRKNKHRKLLKAGRWDANVVDDEMDKWVCKK